jgi:AI-2 transport protein TqsA
MQTKQFLPLQNFTLPFLAIAAATLFLYFASPIVIPLVIAASLAYILNPAVEFLKKIRLPHVIAVIIVLIVTFVILGFAGYLLFVQLNSLAGDLPTYWNTIVQFSVGFLDQYRELFPQAGNMDLKGLQLQDFSGVTKYLFRGVSSTISFLFSTLLVLFLTFFILNDQNLLKGKLLRAFSKKKEQTGAQIMEKISTQIQGFLLVKFGTSFALAVFLTLGLLIIGVNYAYVWGPLAGLLNLIPYVGPIIGAIPPLIVAAIQFKAWMPVIGVLILFLVLQNLEGNVITPKLMGDKLNLNPLAILVSVMFWTWLWGGIGILLAIPITASAKVICDHVEVLQPIGVLLGGKKDVSAVGEGF